MYRDAVTVQLFLLHILFRSEVKKKSLSLSLVRTDLMFNLHDLSFAGTTIAIVERSSLRDGIQAHQAESSKQQAPQPDARRTE